MNPSIGESIGVASLNEEEEREEVSFGSWGVKVWKCGIEKIDGLGSESRNLPGVSISEFLKLEMVLKTVCVESSESMRGVLEKKLDRGKEVRSESEMSEDWRWRLDG